MQISLNETYVKESALSQVPTGGWQKDSKIYMNNYTSLKYKDIYYSNSYLRYLKKNCKIPIYCNELIFLAEQRKVC